MLFWGRSVIGLGRLMDNLPKPYFWLYIQNTPIILERYLSFAP